MQGETTSQTTSATEEEIFTQVTLGANLKLQENEQKVLGVTSNTSEDQIGYTFEALRQQNPPSQPREVLLVR